MISKRSKHRAISMPKWKTAEVIPNILASTLIEKNAGPRIWNMKHLISDIDKNRNMYFFALIGCARMVRKYYKSLIYKCFSRCRSDKTEIRSQFL